MSIWNSLYFTYKIPVLHNVFHQKIFPVIIHMNLASKVVFIPLFLFFSFFLLYLNKLCIQDT